MLAEKKVLNSKGEDIGFIIEDTFYTNRYILKNIEFIDNLELNNKKIVSKSKLPTMTYEEYNNLKYNEIVEKNPFLRDIQMDLLNWKNDIEHKVLQLEGSRQIGKTTELLKFAYKNYENVIYINLSNDIYNFSDIIVKERISPLIMEKYCQKGNLPYYVNDKNTIIIIDEIQISSVVYNSIRAINDNLKCDLVVTGSYLGQTLKKEYFQPAGTITYIKMFPLSFKEFCRVFEKENLLNQIDLYGKSDKESYKQLDYLYEIYRKIGGYPEVIKEYYRTRNLNNCYSVIQNLLETLEKESRNYFSSEKETLIFKTVYSEAIKIMIEEKKGSGAKLVENVTQIVKLSQKMIVSRDEISRAIQWLIYSGIIGECNLCNNGNIKEIIPARRLYYMDCGIASYIAGQTALHKDSIDGFITENFVYSELYRLYSKDFKYKKVKGDVPCFSVYSGYELDFMVIGINDIIYGIEVKTDTGNPLSLKVFIDKKLVDKGIVAKKTKGGHGEYFDTIPIYTVAEKFPYNNQLDRRNFNE